jgi:23S rRNA pseudouridine2605 synthase
MEHFGCVVNRLIRVQYGPFYLGKLQSGALEEIEPARVAELLKYLQERGVEI